LRSEESIGFTHVEAEPVDFAGLVALAMSGGGETWREREICGILLKFLLKVSDHLRGQDMGSKKTEVVTGAKAGDDEFLFRQSRSWFFDDIANLIKAGVASDTAACDGDAGLIGLREVNVIAHLEKEAVISDKVFRDKDGMTVAEWLTLLDEGDFLKMLSEGCRVSSFGAWGDNEGCCFDPARLEFGNPQS